MMGPFPIDITRPDYLPSIVLCTIETERGRYFRFMVSEKQWRQSRTSTIRFFYAKHLAELCQ